MNKKIISFLLLLLLQGCISQPKFTEEEKKIAMPVDNISYYTTGFEKLNRLLSMSNQPTYKFQVKTIENLSSATGAMPTDSRGFIRTPLILHMNNLEVIAYEPIYNKWETKTTGFVYFPKMKKIMPDLVINGAITQFDKGILSKNDNRDFDAAFGPRRNSDLRFTNDNSDDLSQIALDLNVFRYQDRSYVSGVATQNKIEIHRQRKKNRFGIFLNGSGVGYSKYTTLQQSKDEALRILSEFSLLQLLGRLYQVPYWKCITPNLKPDELIMQKKVERFAQGSKTLKIKLIEQCLKFYGYQINIDGKLSQQEINTLKQIKKVYKIKSALRLLPNFYRELYLNAPFFQENMKQKS